MSDVLATLTDAKLASVAWTHFWQVTVVAALALLVVRMFCRQRPYLAYALLMLVLVKCLVPPLWSSRASVFSWLQTARVATTPVSVTPLDPTSYEASYVDFAQPLGEPLPPSDPPPLSPTPQKTSAPPSFELPSWPTLLFGVWAVGAIGCVIVIVVGWCRQYRAIRRRCNAASGDVVELADRLGNQLRLRRRPRLWISHSAEGEPAYGPLCFGVLRPTVVLPDTFVEKSFVEAGNTDGLIPILAHELVHLKRGDTWAALLQVVVTVLWWFHPLVWLTSRQLSRQREKCCDQAVLASIGCSAEQYAQGVLNVLRLAKNLQPLYLASGIRPVDVTGQRLEAIMSPGTRLRRRTPWFCWAVLVIGAVMLLPGRGLLTGNEVALLGDDPSKSDTTEDSIGVSRVHLERIAIAMLNYHDEHGHYPPAASLDAQGRPLLSWRVHILPFLDGYQQLYDRFHLDEPWDSPHNRALVSEIPDTFESPRGTAGQGKTHYLGLRGQNAFFPPSGTRNMREITDGLSNTLMLFEADNESAVEWSRPRDFDMPEERPAAGFSGLLDRRVLVALADGSVETLPAPMGDATFTILVGANDSKIVDWNAIRSVHASNPSTIAQLLAAGARVQLNDNNNVWFIGLSETSIYAEQARRLLALDGLEEVSSVALDGKGIGDDVLRAVASLPKLGTISLFHTSISPAGFSVLADCENLTGAHLYGSNINDETLEQVAKWPELGFLVFGLSDVTDAGIAHLTQLPSLASLSIEGADITDAGLASIAKMPKLILFKHDDTKITADGIANLQKQRPQLQIQGNPARTDSNTAESHRLTFTATPGIEDRTSWTALAPSTPVEGKPNYMLIAQVTLGGQFPVVLNDEKLPAHGKELVTIKMTRGNDDALDVLVTKPDGEEEQIELVRDKSIDVRVGDETYNLSYSTTTVAADQTAETDKATIIVSWRPDTDSGTQHGGDRADKPNANDGATATPPKHATFAIDGRCVDGDGNPVPGATVTLVNTEHYAVGNELIARTQSAADGRFRFANAPNLPLNDLDKLPLGVAAQSSGRASAFGEVSSDEPPEMQLVLLPSEPLRGRVTDVDGHPIAGALVRFGLTLPRIEDFACAYTDDDGEFQIDDVSETGDPAPPTKKLDAITLYPWAYRITAEGFVSQTRSYLEQRPREVQVELERGASMTGRVLFADSGLPAAGVRVAVSPSPSGKKGPPESEPRAADGAMIHIPAALTITDKSGQFRVSGLRGGPHDASFFAADYAGSRVDRLQLTVGETLESDGVQLVRGGEVYGTLIDSDTGAALDASDNRISLELSRRPREPGGSAASARVQADGTFRIRVLPGEYQLGVAAVFHAAGRSPDRKGFWKFLGHVPFELTRRPTRDITIAEGEEKELVLEGRISPLPPEVRANAKDGTTS